MFRCTGTTVNRSVISCSYVVSQILTAYEQENPLIGLIEDFGNKCAAQGHSIDSKSVVVNTQRNLFNDDLDVKVSSLIKRKR